jgi:hypothetical protein
VAVPLPFSQSELRLLRVLLKRKVRFMVVGLSAATLQGAPVVTQDVYLWFENLGELKMSRALREVGAAYVPPTNFNPPMLAGLVRNSSILFSAWMDWVRSLTNSRTA